MELAEVKAGVFTVSPMLGGIRMEGNQPVEKDGMAYSLGIDYNLTEGFGLETVLAVGVGGYNLSSNHEFMANYCGGLLYYFANNPAFRAVARHLMALEGKTQHNLLYTVGFLFQLAAATPAPAAVATLDSDGDGVPDYLDQCPDTPLGVPVDETGCPLTLTLRINFAFDSAVIGPEYRSELDRAAAFVRENDDVPFILISGHTDSRGSTAYNQRLSEWRAAAVRQALIADYGMDSSKLISRGYGAKPAGRRQRHGGRPLHEPACRTVVLRGTARISPLLHPV